MDYRSNLCHTLNYANPSNQITMAIVQPVTETKAVVLAWPNASGEEHRVITWNDVDTGGQLVVRTVTLHLKNSQCRVELEEWDAYVPDLLRKGAGDIWVKPV